MTLLGPLLMAGVFIVPVIVGMQSHITHNIMVLDETGWFQGKFKNNADDNGLIFKAFTGSESAGKDSIKTGKFSTLLYIAKPTDDQTPKPVIFSEKQPDINIKNYVGSVMEKEIEKQKLTVQGITEEQMKALKVDVNIATVKINKSGQEEKSSTELAMILGYVSSLIIYMFILIYGIQVMRGVTEEKTSRIIEVIISSVKPFELMMGKIIGIALVCLTQVLLWIVLTTTILGVFNTVSPNKLNPTNTEQISTNHNNPATGNQTAKVETSSGTNQVGNDILSSLKNVNVVQELSLFILYFLGGYLLYAALFAAVGAAVDSETDTQQFMLPITVPLIISIVAAQAVMRNPDGPLAFWLSIIPFTSPIVMMVRLPFNVPIEQIALSLSLLVLGFLGTTWLAAKVYRTGILMYGKKVNYKELWKWVKYKG